MRALYARFLALSPATRRRLVSLPLFVGTALVLAIAVWLEPADAGHSTHRQLGLSGCTILTVTGYPCPMCGATTTFALWASLRPLTAIANQPFASLLFLMTAGTFALSLVELFDPRGRWERIVAILAPWELSLSVGFLSFMGLSWVYKAWLMA